MFKKIKLRWDERKKRRDERKKKKRTENFLKELRNTEIQSLARMLKIKNCRNLTMDKLRASIVTEKSDSEIEKMVGSIRVKSQSGEKLLLSFFTDRNWITEAVVLTSIPIAAFMVSYIFELGYTEFFHIPKGLISIDLKLSFYPIFITSSFLFLLYFYVFRFSTEITLAETIEGLILTTSLTLIGFIILRIILMIRIFNIARSPLGIHNNLLYSIIAAIFFLSITYDYRTRFITKQTKIYERIHIFSKKSKARRNSGSIEQILITYVVAQFIFLIYFVHSFGLLAPNINNDFLVFDHNKKTLLVLKKYSDILICAPYNPKDKIVFQKFYFKKMDSLQDTIFEIKAIGPLVSQRDPNP